MAQYQRSRVRAFMQLLVPLSVELGLRLVKLCARGILPTDLGVHLDALERQRFPRTDPAHLVHEIRPLWCHDAGWSTASDLVGLAVVGLAGIEPATEGL